MLDEVRELCKSDTVKRNIRIHFPNGERPDICNVNIGDDSININQSICSTDGLKFGLCESTVFECEVNDIENKYINGQLNPEPLRGNIKGCEIEVSQEIDISSLSTEFINQYGQTASDVDFPFYSVNIGSYKIDSCKKQSNFDNRKIVAYDKISNTTFSRNIMEWLVRVSYSESDAISHIVVGKNNYRVKSVRYPWGILPSMRCDDVVDSLLMYYGVKSSDWHGTPLDLGELTNTVTDGEHFANGYMYEQKIKDVEGESKIISIKGYPVSLPEIFSVPKGRFKVVVEYNRAVIKELNQVLNTYQGTSMTVDDRIDFFNNNLVKVISFHQVLSSESDPLLNPIYVFISESLSLLPNTVVDASDLHERDGNSGLTIIYPHYIPNEDRRNGYVSYPGIIKVVERIYRDPTNMNPGIGGLYDTDLLLHEYNIVSDIKVVPIVDSAIMLNGKFKFPIEYDYDNGTCNFEAVEDLTLRNVIGSILEMNGCFGHINNDGIFDIVTLGGAKWLLTNDFLLKSDWIMNYHQNNYISRDEEEEAWYDEDTGTVLYGSAKVSWDNNLTIVEYIGNKNGKRTYNFTDNILMCSGMFGVCDMYDILKNMWNRIQGIRYTPMLVSTIAMPDREIGSRIIINDDGKEIKSYVFNKQTNGSTSMMDEIDSTYM